MNLLRISFVFLICVLLIGLVESRPRPRPWNLKKKLANIGNKIKGGIKKVGQVVKEVGNKVKEVVVKTANLVVDKVKKSCPVLKSAEDNRDKIANIIKQAGGVIDIGKIANAIKNKNEIKLLVSIATKILKLSKEHICST